MKPAALPDGPPRSSKWAYLLVAAAALLTASYIFRPWLRLPFDIWDYREFIPVLREGGGPPRQFHRLLSYYGGLGRFNPLFYAAILGQWIGFGEHSWAWQLARCAFMSLNVGLFWALCRRLGMSNLGAISGATLFIASTSAQRAWMQLVAEPQGLAALLLAALVAAGFQATRYWARSAVGITLLLACAILTKEILAVLGPVIVVLAWSRQPDGSFALPTPSRRNLVLGFSALAVALLAGLGIWHVRHGPSAGGYGMAYGVAPLTPGRLLANILAILMPVRTGLGVGLGLLFPANLTCLLVVILGWRIRFRTVRDARKAVVDLGWIAGIVLLGAVAYLPWPKFDDFYALPFLAGPALLFGCAVAALERGGRSHRLLAVAAPLIVLLYGAVVARRDVATAAASLQVNVVLARSLREFARYDSLLVVGPGSGPRMLPVHGFELRDYAIAMRYADDAGLPRVRDASCEEGVAMLRRGAGATVLATYSYGCGPLPQPTRRLVGGFTYRDWMTFAPIRDSLSIDLLIPTPP